MNTIKDFGKVAAVFGTLAGCSEGNVNSPREPLPDFLNPTYLVEHPETISLLAPRELCNMPPEVRSRHPNKKVGISFKGEIHGDNVLMCDIGPNDYKQVKEIDTYLFVTKPNGTEISYDSFGGRLASLSVMGNFYTRNDKDIMSVGQEQFDRYLQDINKILEKRGLQRLESEKQERQKVLNLLSK